jgi:hypothetical protein
LQKSHNRGISWRYYVLRFGMFAVFNFWTSVVHIYLNKAYREVA